MPICLFQAKSDASVRFGLIDGERVIDIAAAGGPQDLTAALQMSAAGLEAALDGIRRHGAFLPRHSVEMKAPIDQQEVWAAGVTYLRSRDARMEESQEKSVYDRVYEAERPELFLKATPNRVVGPGEAVAIRGDSTWDVPEPECTLVINSSGEIIGYTIGNDVSSRSIEGENPLYLPQAKMYDRCAALGPVIALASEVVEPGNLPIAVTIRRGGEILFQGESSTNQLHRSFEDLKHYLFTYNSFDHGVFLMTGTGIVPPSEFTLEDGDEVEITIIGIGTLVNPVVRLG